jgi:hypothetical protein
MYEMLFAMLTVLNFKVVSKKNLNFFRIQVEIMFKLG